MFLYSVADSTTGSHPVKYAKPLFFNLFWRSGRTRSHLVFPGPARTGPIRLAHARTRFYFRLARRGRVGRAARDQKGGGVGPAPSSPDKTG